MRPTIALGFLFVLVGCENGVQIPDDSSSSDDGAFCFSLDDGNQSQIDGEGGGSTSGVFSGWIITDASEDFGINDTIYVGYVDYTVENIDVGGTTLDADRSDNLGYFSGSGAVGTWEFKAGKTVNNQKCQAEMTFTVEVGRHTSVCPVLSCAK